MLQSVRHLGPVSRRARLLPTQASLLSVGRAFSADAEASSVLEVRSDEEFTRELASAGEEGKLTVVDYTAAWCGPCKVIAPVFKQLSQQYPQARFLKIDIDEPKVEKTVTESNIGSVPTFAFFKKGKELARVMGADVVSLRNQLQKLA
ncbi:hypothetical protein CVIRNUC_003756 [Coccomyxa viridis]|uniref:Thioredoxin domain-containing protein n=1 Tax=Coccomyxa viridis TaxID=1274662 RepID=A0AAV1I158_9CHLO|nr:hypothetical protein CVIRNUC_003756 [Coccomyxa viridis]